MKIRPKTYVNEVSALIALISIAAVTCYAILRGPDVAGDSVAMSQSAALLVKCLQNHQFHGCAGTNQYGLLQNIPLMFLIWKGISTDAAVRMLGILNIGIFIAFMYFLWKSFSNKIKQLAIYVILLGPILPYISSTLGEMSQLAIFSIFIISVVQRRKNWLMVTGFLAATSRETAFLPLIFIAVGFCILEEQDIRKGIRNSSRAITSVLVGLTALLAFNELKFGTWRNLSNLHSEYVTPGFWLKIKMFVAIWTAPGGGVLFFWAGAGIISLSLFAFLLINRSKWAVAGSLLIIAGLAGSTASLAMWFAPFGWVAWGPRLMIPTIGMVCLGAMCLWDLNKLNLGAIGQILLKPVTRIIISVAVGITALPSFGVLNHQVVINRFFATDSTCPRPAIIQEDRNYYFHCLQHGSWKFNPSMWRVGLDGMSPLMWGVFLLVLGGFLLTLQSFSLTARSGVKDDNLTLPIS